MSQHRSVVAAKSCVECHMPQVAINPHLRFTNHWIGIHGKGAMLIPVSTAAKGLPPVRQLVVSGAEVESPNDPADLMPLFEEALARSEKKFGTQSAETARSESDLGLFLKTLNDSSSAVAPLTRALEIDQADDRPEPSRYRVLEKDKRRTICSGPLRRARTPRLPCDASPNWQRSIPGMPKPTIGLRCSKRRKRPARTIR